MICGICNIAPAKYKCPKCFIQYCSLVCFKGEKHIELDNSTTSKTTPSEQPTGAAGAAADGAVSPENAPDNNTDFERVLNDSQIQSMLKIKSLQFHLSTIIKILSDPQVTNEPTMEGRREIANKKLCNLRIGGIEENELIEDFVDRTLYLLEQT